MRTHLTLLCLACCVSLVGCSAPLIKDGLLVGPNDLTVPETIDAPPAPGLRVRQALPGYEDTDIRHTLYLPRDWRPGRSYPLIVEYPGNGPFESKHGDVSSGEVEGCVMGYGASGGKGYIWIAAPFVDVSNGRNATRWWGGEGGVEATVAYCKAVVAYARENYGADPERVILAGFSRGAIACNHIGLHDDEIAAVWRGFICHSHYDGVRKWSYENSDRASARRRLQRLHGRPQWISQEGANLTDTVEYLNEMAPDGDFTFVQMPFLNHTADWTLKNLPERRRLRRWLDRVLADP
ncbi:MAG: hypothetical protein ACYTGQ_03620 [Planctomycetota bacterium]|jgi:dipeptidyl aminopeptidase/acylaminoacyl peptidase